MHEAGKFADLFPGKIDEKGKRTKAESDLDKQKKCVYCYRVHHVRVATRYYCKICAARLGGPSQAALCCPGSTEVKQCMLKHVSLGIPSPPTRKEKLMHGA